MGLGLRLGAFPCFLGLETSFVGCTTDIFLGDFWVQKTQVPLETVRKALQAVGQGLMKGFRWRIFGVSDEMLGLESPGMPALQSRLCLWVFVQGLLEAQPSF